MFINKSILLVGLAAAATSALAAPLDTSCAYEADFTSITCKGNNEHYARGVEVTYDMRDLDEAAVFMRRADALDVIGRGIGAAHRRASDVWLPQDSKGSVVGQTWHAGSGTSQTSVTGVNDHGGSNIGSQCKFGNSRRGMRCVSEGNPIGLDKRDSNPHVEAGKRDFRTWSEPQKRDNKSKKDETNLTIDDKGVHGSGGGSIDNKNSNMGAACIFDNSRKRGEASVQCIQKSHPTYGPMGFSGIIGARASYDNEEGNAGNFCKYFKRMPGAHMKCVQTTSPIYGPNGGTPTMVQKPAGYKREEGVSYDLRSLSQVVAFHQRRSQWPGADASWKRSEQLCDGTPVGPIGAHATYVTPRALPTGVVYAREAPAAPVSYESSPMKRCSNKPVPPTAPTVTYIKYDDWVKQQKSKSKREETATKTKEAARYNMHADNLPEHFAANA